MIYDKIILMTANTFILACLGRFTDSMMNVKGSMGMLMLGVIALMFLTI